MILIGSRALKFRAPFLLSKEPKDFDFIAYSDEAIEWLEKHEIKDYEIKDGKIISESNMIEIELIKKNSSSEMLHKIVEDDPKTIKTDFGLIPNLNLLFALKQSHRFLKNSPHFWKTAIDWHKMKNFGCEILPEHQEFLKLREKETYNYSHPKLNVKKDDFFKDDQIVYQFDHDDIHKSVAHFEKPAYLYYLKDGEQVQCDKEKFFNVSEEIRLFGCVEEAMVLALERSLIPFKNKLTPKQAFLFALSKVASSITSGWFRLWCWTHIFEVIKLYHDDYYEKFQKDLAEGKIGKFKGSYAK